MYKQNLDEVSLCENELNLGKKHAEECCEYVQAAWQKKKERKTCF